MGLMKSLRRLFGGGDKPSGKGGMSTAKPACTHMDQIQNVTPSTTEGCEECLKIGGTWVHLRMCMICGKVGCCDNSPNRHATAHYKEIGHPIVTSMQPGERWMWCYPDALIVGNRKE